MVFKRFTITMINIFCSLPTFVLGAMPTANRPCAVPPLAVMLLAGPETDMLINCLLFLCAVIPAHIHGFYISAVYFYRKRKVRKGLYPGGYKTFIYSDRILNGGASNREVERLRLGRQLFSEKSMRMPSMQGPANGLASDRVSLHKSNSRGHW
jgi:uncharacterized membrane protein YqaE (UPF0057 family)